MDAVVNTLICVLVGSIFFVLWRWSWLRGERRKLIRASPAYDERFNPHNGSDEDDKTYHGRVIKRLRSQVIEGRVEIHWEYVPGFAHRGFILTAKCRRNAGDWQTLAMEPYQDSGSWIECFNYGESRSYLFTVKKTYRFFFGLFGEPGDEIVYDQISFSVRKGKYLKEKKELIQDRRELLVEVKEYARTEQEIRQMMRAPVASKPSISKPESLIDKLEKRRQEEMEMANYVETETAKINAQSWSDERKSQEIQRLNELMAEMKLEE